MRTQTEPAILDQFLGFLEDQATSRSGPAGTSDAANPYDLDAMMALAVAAYEELGRFTQEVAGGEGSPDPQVLREVRDMHARYFEACQPVLRLLETVRGGGIVLRHIEQFMQTIGEAHLIAHRYDRVMDAERQAQAGRGRSLAEVRDGVRRRVRAGGG